MSDQINGHEHDEIDALAEVLSERFDGLRAELHERFEKEIKPRNTVQIPRVEFPEVNVTAPEVHVAAPIVNVPPSSVNVDVHGPDVTSIAIEVGAALDRATERYARLPEPPAPPNIKVDAPDFSQVQQELARQTATLERVASAIEKQSDVLGKVLAELLKPKPTELVIKHGDKESRATLQ